MVSDSKRLVDHAGEDRWPHHRPEWAVVRASFLGRADRRLDAETFLSQGFGIKAAIESKLSRWSSLINHARVWQPSRLKGIVVSPEYGTPFLAATQVFDMRPVPRKWLALERTEDAKNRFVDAGTILVTCSGSVGRATLAFEPHMRTLISHDLMRVEPHDASEWGWLYAYLRAPKVRAMMTGAKYGHIIKHLEASHLNSLPVIEVDDATRRNFASRIAEVLDLRNAAHRASQAAENLYVEAFGALPNVTESDDGFSVRASALFARRRRFEAAVHQPRIRAIYAHLSKRAIRFDTLKSARYRVWLPTRFRRIPAEDGVLLVDSSSIFEINPDVNRRIADTDFGDEFRGRVKPGWLLLARSGQVYGINGSIALSHDAYEGKVVSDDIIRIAPPDSPDLRPGYALTALTHPILGRPLMKGTAYGSSIPHIDVSDAGQVAIARLSKKVENAIADFAEQAAALRGRADVLEDEAADLAEEIIDAFIAH